MTIEEKLLCFQCCSKRIVAVINATAFQYKQTNKQGGWTAPQSETEKWDFVFSPWV